MPSFPKVFLFSPFWEEYLSLRPYAPLKQSVLPSDSHSDDLLSFQVTIGPLHSNSCYFVRGFESLQGCQVFGIHEFPSSDCPVPGLFKGRLHLRLEWSDWSSQGARLLDSLGYFKTHSCEVEGGSWPSSQLVRDVRMGRKPCLISNILVVWFV